MCDPHRYLVPIDAVTFTFGMKEEPIEFVLFPPEVSGCINSQMELEEEHSNFLGQVGFILYPSRCDSSLLLSILPM